MPDLTETEPTKAALRAQTLAKRDALPNYCKECTHLKLCWGECPKNRLVCTPSGEPGLNYLCPGLKRFYAHIGRDMPEILRRIDSPSSTVASAGGYRKVDSDPTSSERGR